MEILNSESVNNRSIIKMNVFILVPFVVLINIPALIKDAFNAHRENKAEQIQCLNYLAQPKTQDLLSHFDENSSSTSYAFELNQHIAKRGFAALTSLEQKIHERISSAELSGTSLTDLRQIKNCWDKVAGLGEFSKIKELSDLTIQLMSHEGHGLSGGGSIGAGIPSLDFFAYFWGELYEFDKSLHLTKVVMKYPSIIERQLSKFNEIRLKVKEELSSKVASIRTGLAAQNFPVENTHWLEGSFQAIKSGTHIEGKLEIANLKERLWLNKIQESFILFLIYESAFNWKAADLLAGVKDQRIDVIKEKMNRLDSAVLILYFEEDFKNTQLIREISTY